MINIYLPREEMISRFNAVANELLDVFDLGMLHSMAAAQMLPGMANAIPDSALMVEFLMKKLAWVYGYTAVFVNENYRNAEAAEPEGLPRPFCACDKEEG